MAEQIGLEAILDVSKYNRGVDQYLKGLDRMQRETAGFDSKTSGFGTKIAGSFDSVGKAVLAASAAIAAAGVAAGVAIGKFVASGVKDAIELESRLDSIVATLGNQVDAFGGAEAAAKALGDEIIKLGLDPNLVVTTEQAADAIENLARNGISMTDILNGAARATILLADSTGADFGQAADIASDTMAIFNIQAADMERAVDGITAVTNASKFTINDYALALAQGGGVASATGVEFEDFNATIAAISPLFSSGSDAGTSFKTMLLNLIPKSDEAAAMMQELGLMTADGANKFYDANGQLKSMAEITELLNAATVGLTEEQKNNALSTIFGTDAMRAAVGVANAGAVAYNTAEEAAKALGVSIDEAAKFAEGGITAFEALQLQFANTSAADQAAMRMDNLKGKLEILKGQVDAVKLSIGQQFLPILTQLADWANAFISQNAPAVIKFFTDFAASIPTIVTELGNFVVKGQEVFTTISSLIQPITDAIGSFVEWKDVLIVLAGAVAFVVVPAIAAMIAAIAPIILIIGGAILAVAGLRTAWENDWLGIQTKTTEAISAIQTAFGPLTTAIRDHLTGALNEVKNFATGNETEWTHTQAIWEGVKETATNVFSSIVDFATTKLPEWKGKLAEWGIAAGQWILNAAAQVGSYIANYTSALVTEITNKLPEWQAKLTEWSTAAGEWLVTASGEVGAKLGEWYTALSTELDTKLETWETAFDDWIAAAGEWLTTAADEIVTKLGEWYTALSGALGDKLPSWMAAFNDWTTEAWNWIITAAGLVGTKIGEWYTELSAAVSAKFTTWQTAFVDWAKELYDWIKDSLPFVATEIGTWYTELADAVATKLPTFTTEMLKWATELVAWISSETAKALPHLGTWLGKILAWTPTGAVLLAAGMLKLATALISWIGNEAANALPKLGTWLGTILGWIIGTGVPALVKGVIDLAKALVGWITGTGGVTVEDSAKGKLAAEFEKFKTALGTAIDNMWEGIKGFVKNFGQSFFDELSKNIDWHQLGIDIINGIQSGVETVSTTLTDVFKTIATDAYNFFFETDWLGLGMKVVLAIRDGAIQMASLFWNKLKGIAQDAYDKFLEVDWLQLGKDVIAGIKKGLEENGQQIIDFIVALGKQALADIKTFFGIKSPSTVMMEVGFDIVRGLIKGIDEQQTQLKRSVGRMTSNVINTIIRGSQRATDVFAGLAGSFSSAGGGWADLLNTAIEADPLGVHGRPGMQWSISYYGIQKKNLDMLKQQADLINLIRESGGNPSEVLLGVTLGTNADPKRLLDVVSRTMAALNAQLEQSIKTAASMLPEYVNKLRANRQSIEDVEATFTATHLDQRERYAQGLAKIDTQIAGLEQDLLATGNKALKPMIEALDVDRKKIIASLQTYLEQTRLLEKTFAGLKNLTGPGQTSAQRFVDEQIQPILDAFAAPMDARERAAWLNTVQTRVAAVNSFIDQMREVERLQQRIGGNNAFGDLADPLAIITDISTPEATRTRLINTLTVYINQMERLFALQQDLSVGTQADPLVARFKTERLDAIEQQLKNINLSEAERARLIEQYRMEQEKILAIQQKQAQLNFLQEQLSLLDQVKRLAEDFPALVNVKDIFAGVQLGANASIDGLLQIVSKTIDAVIRTTNKQLGIASPSKVFEQIGQYMMGGLARGIESSVMRPISSLSGAISELPYALGGRNLTLNMGGVTISNGMDEVMFEARVRQILDRAFP